MCCASSLHKRHRFYPAFRGLQAWDQGPAQDFPDPLLFLFELLSLLVQVPTTSGPLAQPPASASLLDGWQDASLCNSKVIGSSSSTIAGDASVLTHSAAQQAGLQQTLHVSSAFISPECDLGCHNLSDPALHLMENTLAALQQLQLKEHQQQTGGQHEQELQQQYEQQQYEQQQYEQQQRSQAYESQSSSSQWGASATVFFAGVSPIATTEALLGVFAQFGRVMNINLFKPYKGSKTSKVSMLAVCLLFRVACTPLAEVQCLAFSRPSNQGEHACWLLHALMDCKAWCASAGPVVQPSCWVMPLLLGRLCPPVTDSL
jgi:hypothetical protein